MQLPSLLLEEAICPILMAPRNAKESDLQVVHACEHFVFFYAKQTKVKRARCIAGISRQIRIGLLGQ